MAFSQYVLRRLMPALIGGAPSPERRRTRRSTPTLDSLEGRVVLSRFGGLGSRAAARLATAAAANTDSSSTTSLTLTGGSAGACGAGLGSVQDEQLASELETLRTDVGAVLSGSAVTDAQRLAPRTDLRTLAAAGFRFDKATLAPVVDSLLAALADGTYDSDAAVSAANRAAFTALFSGSSVSQATIDRTYTDIVAVARGLDISTDELNTLAADREAIQASLARLGITSTRGAGQTNLDFILSPGGGGGYGRRRGGRGRF